MKNKCVFWVSWFAYRARVAHLFQWIQLHLLKRRQVVILGYHRIGDAHDFLPPGLVCGRRDFEQHLKLLRRRFVLLSLEELVTRLQRREPIPFRSVVVTFDDGFADVFTNAFPLLKKHSVPATLFLTTDMLDQCHLLPLHMFYYLVYAVGFHRIVQLLRETGYVEPSPYRVNGSTMEEQRKAIERILGFQISSPEGCRLLDHLSERLGVEVDGELPERLYLSWETVQAMENAGLTFCPHSRTHPRLALLPEEEQVDQIGGSYSAIKQRLRSSSPIFAYPFGDEDSFDDSTRRALRKDGLVAACSNIPGKVTSDSDLYALCRIPISSEALSLPEMFCEMVGFLDWLRNVNKWLSNKLRRSSPHHRDLKDLGTPKSAHPQAGR